MRLKGYGNSDGRKVWLDRDEVALFLEQADDTEQRLAFGLGVRCGLRSQELVSVTAIHVIEDAEVGPRVRVEHAKGDHYREVPMPVALHTTAETFAEVRDAGAETPLVDRSTRTIQRWVDRAAAQCADETGDPGWQFLGPHDLRRTWGTLLVESGVEAGMIMDWGGWTSWDTFRDHYLGAYSPEMERRQAAAVPWLDVSGSSSGGRSPMNQRQFTSSQ